MEAAANTSEMAANTSSSETSPTDAVVSPEPSQLLENTSQFTGQGSNESSMQHIETLLDEAENSFDGSLDGKKKLILP